MLAAMLVQTIHAVVSFHQQRGEFMGATAGYFDKLAITDDVHKQIPLRSLDKQSRSLVGRSRPLLPCFCLHYTRR